MMRGLGSTFGGYKLEQVVLTDAVSVTYRATMGRELATVYRDASSNLSRPVLLRITDPLIEVDADQHAARFLRRLRAAAQVEHRAVAKPIDTGVIDGRVYVATRWTGGLTLEEHIRREGRMEAADACDLLLPVAEGLDALHAADVVHGAISPRTIWIEEFQGLRSARITHFGLDTSLRGHDFGGTGDGVLSDAFYVAPEQFRGATAGAASDLYALACTLHHCVGGRPPFSSATAAVRAGALAPGLPVFDFSADEVPIEFRNAIAVGMSDQPHHRHATCVQLVRAAHGPNGSARQGALVATAPAPDPVPAGSAPPRSGYETSQRLPVHRSVRFAWPIAALLLLAGIAIALILTGVFANNGQLAGSLRPDAQPRVLQAAVT
jgi:serine/threonine-protein kinase